MRQSQRWDLRIAIVAALTFSTFTHLLRLPAPLNFGTPRASVLDNGDDRVSDRNASLNTKGAAI